MANESEDEFNTLEEEIEELLPPEELETQEASEPLPQEKQSSNKLLYILIAVFAVLAFSILGFVAYLYMKEKQAPAEDPTATIIQNIQNKSEKAAAKQETSTPAKELFKESNTSLKSYHDISQYNQALSFYNIGVTQAKQQHYDKAMQAFEQALPVEKLRFEAALNLAISAYQKGDNQHFRTYLTLATKELSSRQTSPLYSYYRTLIDYYRGFYAEALTPLRHPTSDAYADTQNQLLVKLYTAFDNPKEAIKILEEKTKTEDFFTLGLLYAKQEEYSLSKKYLEKSLEDQSNALQENMALALVDMKLGLFKQASETINKIQNKYPKQITKTYPIQATLNPALFDPVLAQKDFQKHIFFNKRNSYSLLFYFAPFHLINPKQTVQNLHQGAYKSSSHAYNPALEQLQLSEKISNANLEVTRGIKAAFEQNLYKAKEIFEKGIATYPSSATLHYNLGLVYAKIYDFQKAHIHLRKAAILDVNNLYAPLFDHLCTTLLLQEPNKEQLTQVTNRIDALEKSDEKDRLIALDAILHEDITKANASLNQTTFDNALSLILAQLRQEFTSYQEQSNYLLQKAPKDIISNILYLDAHQDKQDIKAYAKAIQERLHANKLDFSTLYSGHAFVKELYIEMLHIAGVVPRAKKELEAHLRQVGTKDISTLQALAYSDIYLQEHDQAYAIYNQLIDKQKQQDSNTLFLASLSAIGAKHHANAIALLELAKLNNKSNIESRYALGVLYHEAKNLEGASIQYAKIGDTGFQSRYFSFHLEP